MKKHIVIIFFALIFGVTATLVSSQIRIPDSSYSSGGVEIADVPVEYGWPLTLYRQGEIQPGHNIEYDNYLLSVLLYGGLAAALVYGILALNTFSKNQAKTYNR